MKKKTRYWLTLIAIGYCGGTIWTLPYIRYVFYDQMIQTMNITNTQVGLLGTVFSAVAIVRNIPGAYLSDKFDAKKIVVFAVGSMTLCTFLYSFFITSYTFALVIWGLMAIATTGYWASLVKYINNMGSADESGKSFGTYYFINGLSGVLANSIPLAVGMRFGFRAAVITVGVMTLLATILIILCLEDEKQLAARGVSLKGDEPIRLKYIPCVLKWPGTYIIFFAYFTTYTLYGNVSYFNPYLIDVIGINPNASSIYSVIRTYGAMLIAPVGGIMADKVFKSTSKWYIVAFSIIAAMFAVVFLFGPDSNQTLVCIYSVLPAIVVMALYSVTYSILRELHINPIVAGTCIGLGSCSGNIVDAMWGPLFGSFIDRYGNQGYTYIFAMLIGVCFLGIANAFWARSHDRKCREGKRVMRVG